MEKSTQIWTQLRPFFQNQDTVLIFKKEQGRPPSHLPLAVRLPKEIRKNLNTVLQKNIDFGSSALLLMLKPEKEKAQIKILKPLSICWTL